MNAASGSESERGAGETESTAPAREARGAGERHSWSDVPVSTVSAAGPRGSFFHRKVTSPVLALLRQGVTPEKLALCLALGAGIGVFPILGTTTAICAVVALALRLNLVAIQVANYLVYPLQLLLIIPFLRLGERLVGAPAFPLSVREIVDRFSGGLLHGVTTLSTALWHATLGWLAVVPLAMAVLSFALRPLLRRMSAAYAARKGKAA